ncbi:MAG: DUF2244 domain-containing protein [Ferrovibrio sp.]|uniref:DUF2244 domain-containing protein n=1 Tax=Ferrovibrio sp. TaxID=1917215 RepID=UPI002606757B|nr:DUF2244 domain-containing protein [Ferrovibrio sp.]MCW0233432.1 DUF2244 domain-containing protein [Ferrovibrio sp.]
MDQSAQHQSASHRANAFFDIELKPYRSLGPRGFVLLIGFVALANLGAGMAFWLLGAWPVFAFCGLDVLLVWAAFKFSYRQQRAREFIRLDADALVVRRVDIQGREKTWRLQPYWLRVDCDAEDESAPLRLWSHGRALTLGAFLSPDERRRLAEGLREALWRWRQPPGAGLRPLDTA